MTWTSATEMPVPFDWEVSATMVAILPANVGVAVGLGVYAGSKAVTVAPVLALMACTSGPRWLRPGFGTATGCQDESI